LSTYNKFLLILIALAYLISPIDLIPDLFVPFVGWIDDAFLIGLIIYYLRFNRLPNFFNWKSGNKNSGPGVGQGFARDYGRPQDSADSRANQGEPGEHNRNRKSSVPQKPHEVLGIHKNATTREIQEAFRDLAKRYHPDRVATLGKEFQDLANQKFIEIKEAYTIMMEGKR
jgi:hypothetical protein